MEKYKQEIINRGYSVVSEMEHGISFVNEKVSTCVILLKEYKADKDDNLSNEDLGILYNTYRGYDLHRDLKSKYIFAEKSTRCVIINFSGDKESIERDPYHFLKIPTNKIYTLPKDVNKNITIKFSPMKDASDFGDFTVDPYDFFDGLCCAKYFEFLAKAKDGDIVKYPKIIENSYYRYQADKLYKIELLKD